MRIDIYCSCSFSSGIAGDVGLGIVLEAKEKSQLIHKTLGYYLGAANKYFAYTTAIKFALSSIQSKYRVNYVVINIDNEEITGLLTSEDINEDTENLSMILEMRRLASSFHDLNVVYDDGVSSQIVEANVIAEKAKISQKNLEMSAERHEVN